MSRTHRQLALLFGVALAARALAMIHGGAVVEANGDEFYYLKIGKSIAQGAGHPGSFRAPLYPALIGATFAIFGKSLTALRVVQIILSLLPIALVYDICRDRFGRRPAFISALACALSPGLVHYTHFFWSETLFVSCFMTFLWALHRFDRSESTRYLVGAGIAIGLAALTKEMAGIFAILVLPWFVLRNPTRKRPAAIHAAIFLALFALLVAPWIIRNWHEHGQYVGLSNCRWFPIAAGNLRTEDRLFNSSKHEKFVKKWRNTSGELAREQFAQGEALRSIKAQQPGWIFRKLRNATVKLLRPHGMEIRFIGKGLYPKDMSLWAARAHVAIGVLGHLLLLLPGVMALWLIRDGPLSWVVLLTIAYNLAVYTVAIAVPRFLVPLLPLFYLYLGPLVVGTSRSNEKWRWAGAIGSAVLLVMIAAQEATNHLGVAWGGVGGG